MAVSRILSVAICSEYLRVHHVKVVCVLICMLVLRPDSHGARATSRMAVEGDSLRATVGVDLLQTVPFLDKPDQATIFYCGLGFEFSLHEAQSLTLSPVAGIFLGSEPPTGIMGLSSSPLFGLDVAFRSYGSYMLGFDGWYIGLTYLKPVHSTIETRHRFQTATILDGLNMSAGLTAALARSTEIAVGIRYSMNQKWRIRDGYTGYNVFTITIAVGFGLSGW